jgi:hypothetical protein
VTYTPNSEFMPLLHYKPEHAFGKLSVTASLERDIYHLDEALYLDLVVKNETMRNISAVKLSYDWIGMT